MTVRRISLLHTNLFLLGESNVERCLKKKDVGNCVIILEYDDLINEIADAILNLLAIDHCSLHYLLCAIPYSQYSQFFNIRIHNNNKHTFSHHKRTFFV